VPRGGLRLALLWLAGNDLRLTLLAVPPVLPLIHRDLDLDEKGVAALAGLPVLLLGLAAVPGSLLIARIGARRALLVGLCAIGVSSALRGVGPSAALLFAATIGMGAGIAISQPTFPALVRLWFPNAVTRATGVWSNGLLVGEVLGASLTLPLVLPLVGSWEASFMFWSVPVLLTAALVALGTPHVTAEAGFWRGAGIPDWRNGRMWLLALFQSSASLIYVGANTFVPDYLHATEQADLVGPVLSSLNASQLPASVVIGLVPLRVFGRRLTSLLVGVAILASLVVVVVARGAPVVVAAGVLGFCSAYILVLSLALPALLARAGDVSRLAGGTFTITYSLAFLASLVAGAVWDATHQPVVAFLPVLLGGAIEMLLGPRLLRHTHEGGGERNAVSHANDAGVDGDRAGRRCVGDGGTAGGR
jgi:CP family cyanate transporter-like MFS transporter